MNRRYGLLSIVVMILMVVPGMADDLTWDSVQTVSQVDNFTIPANGSYIGGIKIYDIDTTKITHITVSADTYHVDVNLSMNSYLFGAITPVTITTNITDYVSNRNETRVFTIYSPGTNDSIILPQFTYTIGLALIYNDQAYWSKNNNPNSHLQPLINNPYNDSTIKVISASKHVSVSVSGGRVDMQYLIGSEEQITGATSNFNDLKTAESSGEWFRWLTAKIPFIGNFLLQTIDFLTIFFGIIFLSLSFILTDFHIILLLVASIGMVHGIIVMSRGNSTPFDGVKATVTDIYSFFKMIFVAIIMFFELIWKVVQAIATIIP